MKKPKYDFGCTDATKNATENATETASVATENATENATETASVATENATKNATETQISPINNKIKNLKVNNYIVDDDNAREFSDFFSEFFSEEMAHVTTQFFRLRGQAKMGIKQKFLRICFLNTILFVNFAP